MQSRTLLFNQRRRVTDRPALNTLARINVDRFLALFVILLLGPVFLFNFATAFLQGNPMMQRIKGKDCLGRPYILHRCHSGVLLNIALHWSVFSGQVAYSGMPLSLDLAEEQKTKLQEYSQAKPGLFNVVQIRLDNGLTTESPIQALLTQFSGGTFYQLSLIFRAMFNRIFYGSVATQVYTPDEYQLFGLTVHNHSMSSAVEWAVSRAFNNDAVAHCQTGCFLNVNSINLMAKHHQLKTSILKTNRCFADGAGIRLAAKQQGITVKENVNGTDMLPYLCQSAVMKGRSIYLLGAKPGVAQDAADNLQMQFPDLVIAGVQHGYVKQALTAQLIQEINDSKADILLVAMGSPMQEKWLEDNASKLKCGSALAVGGLFDFYSGNIPRAPVWMREIGMEWVWRLLQEPKTKFHRYVVGNPLFLIQIYLFNRARKGW